MATAKTGNWFIENPQRARSNNSAMLLRNATTREQFAKLMKSVKEFGEPGCAVYTDLEKMLADPNVDAVSICTPSGMHSANGVVAPMS